MSVRIAFFTGSSFALPAIQYLHQRGLLACVVLVDAAPNPDLTQLVQILGQLQIKTLQFNKKQQDDLIPELDKFGAGQGVVHLFRHILNDRLLNYFAGQIFNVHPGALPEYRGSIPLYWQLRNGANDMQLTLHRMIGQVDAGEIGATLSVPIHPFDNLICLYQKCAQMLPQLLQEFLAKLENAQIVWQKQSDDFFYPANVPMEKDIVVNWGKISAAELVQMARAGGEFARPKFRCKGIDVQIVQATEQINVPLQVASGTIIEVGLNSGFLVATSRGIIKLDIVITPQGIFDGYRFAILYGLDAGLNLAESYFR